MDNIHANRLTYSDYSSNFLTKPFAYSPSRQNFPFFFIVTSNEEITPNFKSNINIDSDYEVIEIPQSFTGNGVVDDLLDEQFYIDFDINSKVNNDDFWGFTIDDPSIKEIIKSNLVLNRALPEIYELISSKLNLRDCLHLELFNPEPNWETVYITGSVLNTIEEIMAFYDLFFDYLYKEGKEFSTVLNIDLRPNEF
jgi:hypothetical protein